MNAKIRTAKKPHADEGLLSVAEAAELLRISQSTLWRWIKDARVPAYRVGPKRVWLKHADLGPLLNPRPVSRNGREVRGPHGRPLTPSQRAHRLAVIEDLRRFQARLLAERGGKPFEESWKIIDEMRQERTKQLG